MLLQTSLAFFASLATALPATQKAAAAKAPFFTLAGDSTTAVQSTGGGGWGNGFLQTTLKSPATGKNLGHNGATTVSFREMGDWATVLSTTKSAAKDHAPYVTIQFGHNDQKPDKGISMADLTANLVKMVEEVRAIPATPILVTSLSRRQFDSKGKVKESLADVVAATKEAAKKSKAVMIDLNAASTKYLNAIGSEKAATYNLNPTDFTHLNAQGSVVFGNMVATLIKEKIPSLNSYIKPVKEVEQAIKKGTYILPKA
jgi:lysophospholipase L1-like esterase